MDPINAWGTFQHNEVANLIFGIIAALIVVSILMRANLPSFHLAFVGFFFVLSANFFTVIEGIFWQEGFNFLEHLSYALAGLSFTYSSWKFSRAGLSPDR